MMKCSECGKNFDTNSVTDFRRVCSDCRSKRLWKCRYGGPLGSECTPETGGKVGTLHKDCGWQ